MNIDVTSKKVGVRIELIEVNDFSERYPDVHQRLKPCESQEGRAAMVAIPAKDYVSK